jgi:MFS family permease
MQRAAQDWLVLQLTHNSGIAVGVTTALQFLPQTLFGLWGGVIADRYPRRRLLLITQTVMGVQALLLGILTLTGAVRTWHVYVLALMLGTAAAIDSPARNAFVADMVNRTQVPEAVGLNTAQFNAARILGPAAAGLMISVLDTGPVFLLNAVSYLAVLAGLLRMRTDQLPPTARAAAKDIRLTDALRHIRSRADLLLPITLIAVVGTFGLNFQVTISLMAVTVFHSGANAFGYLSAAYAGASLLGALFAARQRNAPTARRLVTATVVFGLLEAMLGVMPTYGVFLVMLVPTGIASVIMLTTANSATQLSADPRMRGRVLAVYLVALLGGTPLGAPLVGWVSEHFGARYSLLLGGALCAISAVVLGLVFSASRRLSSRTGTPVAGASGSRGGRCSRRRRPPC